MKVFAAALSGEIAKLATRKKYFVFLIIEALICAFTMLAQLLLNRVSGGVVRVGVFGMTFGLLGFFIRFYIPLIVFMVCCDLFSAEAHDGSIRAALLRPVSRFKLYAAKNTAAFAVAVVYLAALFGVTTLLELATGGSFRTVWTGFFSYLLDALPLICTVLMSALVCQLVPGPTVAMLTSIVLYAGLTLAGTFLPQVGGMLFTSYTAWHNLWIGSPLPFGALFPKIALLAGYALVMLVGGYLLFDRRDF